MTQFDEMRWVIRQNIERFEKLLETEHEEPRRKQLTRLLALEQEKVKQGNIGA
jgi:hypothetical protein